MNQTERSFAGGDIVFQEGDPSAFAFVLVEGNVELIKEGPHGPLTLAVLQPGEMFGEMGVFDDSARSATARAIGQVTVKMVSRDVFLDTLRSDPDIALSVIGGLVDRLRGANNILAQSLSVRAAERPAAAPPQPGLLARLLGIRPGPRRERLEIQVARLIDDPDGEQTRRVAGALKGLKRTRVRILNEPLTAELADDPLSLASGTASRARQVMARSGADLMVWGRAPDPGGSFILSFVSRVGEEEDRLALNANLLRLFLPAALPPDLEPILAGLAVGAIVPASEGKAATHGELCAAALEAVQSVPEPAPADMTTRERASVHALTGNLASAVAIQRGGSENLEIAAARFRQALEGLNREESPFDWAMVQRNRGFAVHALAERSDVTAPLDEAVEAYRAALQVLSKEGAPAIWAGVQNRLGQALYKLDTATEDGELVKHAIAAFQAALQVYSRAESPSRWGDVMSNFAQAIQLIGSQARSPEALEKAVEACRGVLQVRSPDRTPLPWAAAQNNLGSTLFLLGRMTRDTDHLEAAAVAFRQAQDVYLRHAASRMVSITARNLSHVERLLESLAPKGIPPLRWEEERAPNS